MARRRRRGSRREQRQKRRAIINIAMVVAALVIVGYSVYAIQPPAYDPDTLCVVSDELPPHTAIILDKTDEYTVEQSDLIASAIRRAQTRLEVGERMTVFELDALGEFDSRGRFSLCNPGRGNQVNPLFQNPKLIEERYTQLFEGPLTGVLDDLVEPKEAPASPILEALARLAQTEAFSPDAPARRVILVSDMLQNSDVFTAYGGRQSDLPTRTPDPGVTADLILSRFGDGLRGVEVEIRLIARRGRNDLQRGALRIYWDTVFADLGVRARWRDL
ncbi:MAG: hypothetical protein AAFQ67_06985 [Pseudomonadota bacterium]